MQIAVTADQDHWVVVPEFPPPGWVRAEARARAHMSSQAPLERRGELERLLAAVESADRVPNMARLLHVEEALEAVFVVDLHLAVAPDDGSKAGRHATQRALLAKALPGAEPRRLRPSGMTAGFWALSLTPGSSTTARPRAVVVLRRAGLPTVLVDLVMTVWGAGAQEVVAHMPQIAALADQVGPASEG